MNAACNYQPPESTTKLRQSELQSIDNTPATSPGLPVPGQQPLAILDLELYHYFVFKYKSTGTLLRGETFQNLLDVAHESHYVLHNCLAISALQLFQQNTDSFELFERACYLQGEAIRQFQPVLIEMTQKDCIAALIFSNSTATFGLAEHMLNPHQDPTDPIDKILECFQLSRGVSLIASSYWPYLMTTWIAVTIPDNKSAKEEIRASLEHSYPTYQTVRALALGQEDPERRTVCLELIALVFEYIARVDRDANRTPTLAYLVDAYTVNLPAVFRDMLAERKPVALVILAYYAALIAQVPPSWHLRGWPQLLVRRIEAILGPEWNEFLHWPREKVFAAEQSPDGMTNDQA